MNLAHRHGLLIPAHRRSIWVHGDTERDFLLAADLIRTTMADRPHVALVLTARSPEMLQFLSRLFPDDTVLPLPTARGMRRWLRRLQVRHLCLLEGGRTLPPEILLGTIGKGMPTSVVNLTAADDSAAPLLDFARKHPRQIRFCVADEAIAGVLMGRGVPRSCVVETGSVDRDETAKAPSSEVGQQRRHLEGVGSVEDRDRLATDRTRAAIADLLPDGPPLPRVAQDWRVATWRDRVGSSRLWGLACRPLTRRRVDSSSDLRDTLGRPRSILCVGNGPSSEDPCLAAIPHDCLMRVNWRWKTRGFLTSPHVVFVGDARTLSEVEGVVYGVWNRRMEQGLLLRHLLVRGPSLMRYFTMDRISPLIRDRDWPDRPTNGAMMVAAAAALAPERLVIAGIDLYRHAGGRYPGERLAVNAYARAHSAETDLAIIRTALSTYRGDLTVLGDPLKRAMESEVPGER